MGRRARSRDRNLSEAGTPRSNRPPTPRAIPRCSGCARRDPYRPGRASGDPGQRGVPAPVAVASRRSRQRPGPTKGTSYPFAAPDALSSSSLVRVTSEGSATGTRAPPRCPGDRTEQCVQASSASTLSDPAEAGIGIDAHVARRPRPRTMPVKCARFSRCGVRHPSP